MISRSLIALMRIIAVIVGILQIKGIVVCIFSHDSKAYNE